MEWAHDCVKHQRHNKAFLQWTASAAVFFAHCFLLDYQVYCDFAPVFERILFQTRRCLFLSITFIQHCEQHRHV